MLGLRAAMLGSLLLVGCAEPHSVDAGRPSDARAPTPASDAQVRGDSGSGPRDAGDAAPQGDAGPATDGAPGDADAVGCPPDRPWECLLAENLGFGGDASGGTGASLCHVTQLSATGAGSLQSCLDTPAPRWIVFDLSGTIRQSFTIPSGTTLDGRGQRIVLEATAAHTVTIEQSNVILAYLEMRGGGTHDRIHIASEARDVWLHHLTLADAPDELVGIEGTRVTVSWSRFERNGFAILAGGQNRAYPELFATLHHNHFDQNEDRHPFTRGNVHLFNNVIRYTFEGARVSNGGEILSEANVYDTTRSGDGHALRSSPGGSLTVGGAYRSNDDRFSGGASPNPNNDPSGVFDASDHYPYTSEPADDALEERVEEAAGWQDVALPR